MKMEQETMKIVDGSIFIVTVILESLWYKYLEVFIGLLRYSTLNGVKYEKNRLSYHKIVHNSLIYYTHLEFYLNNLKVSDT